MGVEINQHQCKKSRTRETLKKRAETPTLELNQDNESTLVKFEVQTLNIKVLDLELEKSFKK